MGDIAKYLFAWNDWVVMPIVLVVAIYAFVRLRRPSLLVFAFGASLYVGSSVLQLFYHPSPSHFAYNAALVSQYLGMVIALAALVWFWRGDRHATST